jgi:hypothetical protein
MTSKEELKDRVNVRKYELLSQLSELKADARHEAMEARDLISERLYELEQMIKDGWDNLSDAAAQKLNRWLDRS